MKKIEDITIALPIYKRPKNLIKQLDNIKKIKLNNIIILIGDNGQNDFNNKYFATEFPNLKIKYFQHVVNIGHINNFIFLLNNCTTKYFMWMADDDTYETNFLIKLYNEITQSENIVSVMSNYRINRNGKSIKIPLISRSYLADIFFLFNPLPFIKNNRSYLKIFIYGLHKTYFLKKVVNNEPWVSERDILSILRSMGNFKTIKEYLFIKNVYYEVENQSLDDDYWLKFKKRGSISWFKSIFNKLVFLKIKIHKKIILIVFGSLIVVLYYLNKFKKFIIK